MKITEFTAKIKTNDKELVEKLAKCKSPDEAYKAAKAAGLDATKDEFVAEMKKLNEAVKELDEKALDTVAGGMIAPPQTPTGPIIVGPYIPYPGPIAATSAAVSV
jgi:predicted ribosomally synthesized peptide with nif11-like leader